MQKEIFGRFAEMAIAGPRNLRLEARSRKLNAGRIEGERGFSSKEWNADDASTQSYKREYGHDYKYSSEDKGQKLILATRIPKQQCRHENAKLIYYELAAANAPPECRSKDLR